MMTMNMDDCKEVETKDLNVDDIIERYITPCVEFENPDEFMNPYTQNVVDAIGTLGQRNIQQYLAPGATAAAVGSGQFGSKRGAEVLGQALNSGMQNINAAQAQAEVFAYLNMENEMISSGVPPTHEMTVQWLEACADKFQDCAEKFAANRGFAVLDRQSLTNTQLLESK
jgi:hypothetical protein